MQGLQTIYFNIKNFSMLSYNEFRSGNYKKMVDGIWYKHLDELSDISELDIIINFPVNFQINEDNLQEKAHLLTALAKLSGDKISISYLIPRLKEKGNL